MKKEAKSGKAVSEYVALTLDFFPAEELMSKRSRDKSGGRENPKKKIQKRVTSQFIPQTLDFFSPPTALCKPNVKEVNTGGRGIPKAEASGEEVGEEEGNVSSPGSRTSRAYVREGSEEKGRNGFIKVFRNIQETELWPRKRRFTTFEAWVDLNMQAAYEDYECHFNGGQFWLKRGRLVTSVRTLAKRWRWSSDRVCRWLDQMSKDTPGRLKDAEGQKTMTPRLSLRPTAKGTIINILNYPKNKARPGTRTGAEKERGQHKKSSKTKKNLPQGSKYQPKQKRSRYPFYCPYLEGEAEIYEIFGQVRFCERCTRRPVCSKEYEKYQLEEQRRRLFVCPRRYGYGEDWTFFQDSSTCQQCMKYSECKALHVRKKTQVSTP